MTCAEFMSLRGTEQLRVVAWMDGDSKRELRPIDDRAIDVVVRACRQTPQAPVREEIARRV